MSPVEAFIQDVQNSLNLGGQNAAPSLEQYLNAQGLTPQDKQQILDAAEKLGYPQVDRLRINYGVSIPSQAQKLGTQQAQQPVQQPVQQPSQPQQLATSASQSQFTQLRDMLNQFFNPSIENLRNNINRFIGEGIQRGATRAVQQGSFGSPAQEYIFRPIEQTGQQALSGGLAQLGETQGHALQNLFNTLTQQGLAEKQLGEQSRQFDVSEALKKFLGEQELDIQRKNLQKKRSQIGFNSPLGGLNFGFEL